MKTSFITSLLIWCFSLSALSQQYFFKNYDVSHGLINNHINDVIQASDNTLWLATYNGLSNFDGTNFTNYTKYDGLCSNLIRTVFEDSNGRIWVGSFGEKLSYIENGVIHTPTDELLDEYPNVGQFFETKDNTLWIFTSNSILTFKNNEFKLLHRSKGGNDYAAPNHVIQSKDGTIWVATLGKGLAKINTDPFSIEMISDNNSNISNMCYSLYEDEKGVLWIGSYGALFKYSDGSFISYSMEGITNKNRIWSIVEDENNIMWLALYGNGMASFDKKGKFNVINSNNGLVDDYNYKLIIDKEKNKWIASQSNGLIKLRDFAFTYYTEKEGLPNKQVNAIAYDKDNTFALGTNNGIASYSNGLISDSRLFSEFINDIKYDKDNNLWCASGKRYGIVGQTLTENYADDLFYSILITENNEKYFFGERHIMRIKNKQKEVFFYNGLICRTSTIIGGRILLGSYYGIKEFYKDTLTNIESVPKDVKFVGSSVSISKNEALMGALDYLVYLKLVDNTYITKIFPIERFHPIRGFHSLLKDGRDLWIGSDNSINRVDLKMLIENDSVVMQVYDRDLGFINGESNRNAILKSKNGGIFIGSTKGLVEFSPSKFNRSTLAPVLKFSKIELFSELFNDSTYYKNGVVTFPHNKNHLAFGFSAVSLTYPENIKYKYRLKGFRNSEWSKPTRENKVVFSYLPPGEYTFEFTADNGFGVWQGAHQSYQFIIKSPFWKTDWFKFIMTALVLIIGLSYIYFSQRKKKIAQKKLTSALLLEQEKERKRVSKELHDGVGQKLLLIKNSLKHDVAKTPELVESTIEDVRTISRNLHPFQLEKFGLTKAIINMVEEVNDLSEIFFSEEIENIDTYFSGDKEIYLYRIIQECVNNIIKHSKATAAKITIKDKPKKVVITIQDNGIGFNFEKNLNNTKSLGLKSLIERVDFLKGKITFDAPAKKGTLITITSYK